MQSVCLGLLCMVAVTAVQHSFLWPLPQQYTLSDALYLTVDATSFKFIQNTESDIIEQAFIRYNKLCFSHSAIRIPNDGNHTVSNLSVNILNASENTLRYGMDESYNLSINMYGVAILSSNTIWGALRGLETFSQIVIFNTTLKYYQTYICDIYDYPRFSHRGVLIDTSRHFLSLTVITNLLDSMSYAKFNVLHWHMTDNNAFPLESISYPLLWSFTYSPSERYTQNDIKYIINYALYLGIRIIVEFDIPSHSLSWCIGYPNICPAPHCKQPLNPAINDTWSLLNGFIQEMTTNLFIQEEYMHFGSDEVNTSCWDEVESIVEWKQTNGNLTNPQTMQYFLNRVIEISEKYGKKVILWDNWFYLLNNNHTIIEVYNTTYNKSLLSYVLDAGFKVIYAPAPYWYIDKTYIDWQQRYMTEPYLYASNTKQELLIMGGEAAMFSGVVDMSNTQKMLWPAAAAISERLWSNKNVNSTQDALPRIEYFRCLLNERGIQASPTNQSTNSQNPPPGPGSCYSQR